MEVTTSKLQNAFGKYLNAAIDGETITILKNNKPVATLKGLEEDSPNCVKDGSAAYNYDRFATYEEFMEIYGEEEDSEERYELIGGRIYAMTSPNYGHQVALFEISVQFYNWFKGKSCRPLTAPFDVKLANGAERFEDDPNVVQPDILVICDTDKITDKGRYEGVPTLIVEILSPSTKSKDLFVKSSLFMKSGVKEYWIVDTTMKQVTAYQFEDGKIMANNVYKNGDSVISYIFAGLIVDVEDVFI